MTSRPHFDDLNRRYREKDEVSEFQRLWAIFNHWLTSFSGKSNDRDCVEHIKSTSELRKWVAKVIAKSTINRPHRIAGGYAGSHPRFTSNNVISRLFREAYQSKVVEPRINLPRRAGSEHRIRITNAIALSDDQFLRAYRAHAQVLEEGIADFDLTIHQTLPILGIHLTGCCFYRGEVDSTVPTNIQHYANRMLELFRSELTLKSLVELADSAQPTSLASDVIETLYNIRNVAMHGALDFLNEQNNASARAGYDALDFLVRDIRDNW